MHFVHYWKNILRDTGKLWLDENAFSYAGALAFYTLFSLAPIVIIAVTVIGLVLGEDAAQGQIVAQFADIMGKEAAAVVERAVSQSRIEASGILPTLLGVGALMLGATTVFGQMQYSLNSIWGVTASPDRNGLFLLAKKRLFSLMVVLSIGFVLLVSLLLGVALRAVLNYTAEFLPFVEMLLGSAEFIVSLAMIALLFATIFKVLPDVKLSWKDVMAGALVTAILFSLGRYGIAAYLAYTATASAYGAAGSVVIILLWVYYSSLILLFGAAFTRVHLEARGKSIVPRNTAVRIDKRIMS
ncbi:MULTISPECIES: YihY/virulence factor BrkB family protein [Alteromonadaceae]|uniref:YihY/virulence factor BrkB family protein n=1 Tax=Alteromonadaceae TaxID=72275 RepID=UPI001C0A26A4|nr:MULTISPECIES: YihY/virulence factor BrkB family protein [Aliiglaciecola]MBU2876392.1 YihY/virulence factor BrkB family protein [Aliiglaciecola lipolytica]MDO6710608.1 YihY/virulence factor BrkB family protein [Aliiglaciecola sp. 2_MG-2023]MDO6751527.1 YihY/virulence factor BrkB family protein [Aliiglaciecola sp. 1_MG-2023]